MQLYERMIFNIARMAVEECDYRAMGVFLNEFAYSECYNMLKHISDAIRNDALADEECYLKIEKIIQTFEQRGIDTGRRHRAFERKDIEWMKMDEEDDF